MIKILNISVILFCLIFCSCRRDTSNKNNIIWKTKLDEVVPLYTDDPFIYQDLIIQKIRGQGKIVAYNKENGNEIWRWTDGFDKYNVDGFDYGGHVFNNLFVTGDVNLTVAIDLDTGKTVWDNLGAINSVPFITGVDEKIVKYDYIPDEEYFIRLGDATTGEFETIHHWERDDDFFIASTLPLIFEWQNMQYIVWSQVKWGTINGESESNQFLHLYNLSERQIEWVSDTIPLESRASGIAGLRPKFYNGSILLENDAIYSFDIEDGSLQWRNYLEGRLDNSRITVADSKIFANNDNDRVLIALNSDTGIELWRAESVNRTSRIYYHDDKVYIAGGLNENAERKLHVFNASSGQKINDHILESDDALLGQYAPVITVDTLTGWIYSGDHENLICIDLDL